MNNRIDAIYARQSVDKKDSISIETICICTRISCVREKTSSCNN